MLLIFVCACNKNKCNKDIKGTYDIDSNNFYVMIDDFNFNLIDINDNDTLQIPYVIDCDEICTLGGACLGYEFEDGILTTENGLTYIKR